MTVVCREVVAEQTWFPSFSPADFPACLEAAQKALTLAGQAVIANRGDPQVTKHNYSQTFAQRKTAPSKDFGRACGEAETLARDKIRLAQECWIS